MVVVVVLVTLTFLSKARIFRLRLFLRPPMVGSDNVDDVDDEVVVAGLANARFSYKKSSSLLLSSSSSSSVSFCETSKRGGGDFRDDGIVSFALSKVVEEKMLLF